MSDLVSLGVADRNRLLERSDLTPAVVEDVKQVCAPKFKLQLFQLCLDPLATAACNRRERRD